MVPMMYDILTAMINQKLWGFVFMDALMGKFFMNFFRFVNTYA